MLPQFPETEIPMKDPASIRVVGSLVAVLALLSFVPTALPQGVIDREITQESFAAYAAGAGADGAGDALATLTFPVAELPEPTWDGAVTYAFLRERDTWSRMDATDYLSPLVNDRPAEPGGPLYWGRLARLAPLERVLVQFEEMLERLAVLGLDVGRERSELAALRRQARDPEAAGFGRAVPGRAAGEAPALLP